MIQKPLGKVVRYIRQVAGGEDGAELSDGQLLERFLQSRDESAFALLVERHGAMVLAVCGRVLNDRHDAEDAFQATFFVLARKAGSIRKRESVASWLHGVACRIALKARTRTSLLRDRERQVPEVDGVQYHVETAWQEVRPILDEELNRLPEKYRLPMVLCYLEGKTNAEAARLLGCPRGTVAGRLARARDQLRKRLVRRGLGLTPAFLVSVLCEQTATAAIPAPLLVQVVNSVCGQAGVLNGGKAITLAEGVLRNMFLTKLKIMAGIVLTLSIVTGSMALVAQSSMNEDSSSPQILAVVEGGGSSTQADDKARLQGTWQVISAERGGIEMDAMKGIKITFKGENVHISLPTQAGDGKFRLFPDKSPKRIDMLIDKEKGMGLGIYKLAGKKLYLCVNDYNDGRPTSFSSEPGSKYTCLVLQRIIDTKVAKGQGNQAELNQLRLENQLLQEEIHRLRDEMTRLKVLLSQGKSDSQTLKAALDFLNQAARQQELQAQMAEEKALKALLQQKAEIEKQKQKLDELLKQGQKAKDLSIEKQKAEEELKAVQEKLKEDAARAISANNLKQIGLAMHNYHDVHNSLPPAAIYSKQGEPLLSWRVAILPYIDHDALYKQFKLEEPWNSPHNIKLLEKMPKIYAPVRGKTKEPYTTYYQVFTGPKTLFEGTTGRKFNEVKDGTSNTLMIVEAKEPVAWTKPADLEYQAGQPLPKLGGMFTKGFGAVIADGSYHFFPHQFNEKALRSAILIDDVGPFGGIKAITKPNED